MHRDELVDHFERWVESFGPTLLEETKVSSLEAAPAGGWVLTLEDRELRARAVVVATGAYQSAHRPQGAETLPRRIYQLLAEEYRNPDALPPGSVLIVGSGQTGCQLAEELHEAGRTVFLSCGRCPWFPRRLDGRDTMLWQIDAGWTERTPDSMPSPAARLMGNPQVTGHGGGRDLNYRTLHTAGVELLGRFAGAEGATLRFADDLAASVDFGDARWADMRNFIDAYCIRAGRQRPAYPDVEPLRLKTRTELDLVREGVGSLIWTTGYRPDYRWVKAPVFDEMGFPIQFDGRANAPGLYFVGVHWLRKLKSAILYGVGEDAQVVAEHIAGVR
jgi:putative flavoprotein involved in K+ transport